MVDLATYCTPLPADVALSEYSRKFYDGTYQWDSKGFTDDVGVYREFDCYDPAAQAPTPLPPMCLSEDEADGGAVGHKTLSGEPAISKVGDDARTFTFASDNQSKSGVATVRCDELFRGHADREHLLSKMEDALTTSRANRENLTLKECYDICGIQDYTGRVTKPLNKGHTPPTSPPKQKTTSQTLQQKTNPVTPSKTITSDPRDFSSPSELSDCPSDISEWDVGKPVLKAKTITNKPIDEMFEQEDSDEPKRKPTTRGVAQKVKKSAKKPTTVLVKSSSTMESQQIGSYTKGTGETSRRRSTRFGNAQGGK